MKTFSICYRLTVGTVAGVALVVVAAGSDSSTEPPGTAPSANTVTQTESSPVVAPTPASDKGLAGGAKSSPAVSSQIAEIVKMTESGVSAAVIRTHVEQSTTLYPPSADEIIYMHGHGIPADTISAFIRRGNELRAQAEQAAQASLNATAQPAPPALLAESAPAPPPAPAPEPAPAASAPATVEAPAYVYSAPPAYPVETYVYPYAYGYYPNRVYVGPSIGFSFGYHPAPRFGYVHPYPGHFHGAVRGYFGRR